MSVSFRGPLGAAAWCLLCAGLALPPAAVAQIEEITVTARKKEENLQDVPISITAFGEEQLRGQGLNSDQDVADFTVNFNTLPQTGRDYDRPVIRGMAAPPSRGEANAGYFIDGIYVSGSIASATTSAVERVEVLRGPQSTQFGRATFSGAINYVTKKPTNEFEGEFRSRGGTHDDFEVGGWVSGPIVEDTLTFLLSGSWSKYGGQWQNNLQENQAFAQPTVATYQAPSRGDASSMGNEETQDYLMKLVWKPWDGGAFDFKYSYTQADDGPFSSLVAPVGVPLPTLPGTGFDGNAGKDPRKGLADVHGGPVGVFNTLNCWLPPSGSYPLPETVGASEPSWWRTSGGAYCGKFDPTGWEDRINAPDFVDGVTASGITIGGIDPGLRKRQNRYFLEFTQDLNDWLVTARGGINTEQFDQAFDLDHTETRAVFGLFGFEIDRNSNDWSTELRLASPRNEPVRVEVGGYVFERRLSSNQRSFPGPNLFFGTNATDENWSLNRTRRNVTNHAMFASFGWDFADEWTMDLEGRYASEEIAYRGGNGCTTANTYYNLTPRLSFTWKPSSDLRFYVQAANGDKPGDVNSEFFRGDVDVDFCSNALQYTTDVLVKPEEQWTYEVGMKSQWFDRRLVANLAVFLIDWSEQSIFQVQNFANYSFPAFQNNEDLVTTLLRNVGDSRNIGGELETTLAVTDELTLVANYGYTHAKFQKGYDSTLANLTGDGDVSGKWIPSAPEHNVVLGAVVSKPIGPDATFTFRTDYAWESKRYNQTNNFGWIGASTLVNLRMGVEQGPWTVTTYVKNLLDDDTPVAVLDFVNFGYGAIAPGPDGIYGGNDDIYPNMFSISPRRGRDYGLEVGYKFGAK